MAFKMFDADGDGEITTDELKKFFAMTEDMSINAIMEELDENKDGTINYHEFVE